MKEGLEKIIASKSKTFLAFCFCFIMGEGVASLFDWRISNIQFPISLYLYISLFFISFVAIIFWSRKIIRFFVLCSLLIVFGIWRFSLTIPNCASVNTACAYNNRKVEFTGVVSEDPDIRIDQARYTMSVEKVGDNQVNGQVLITTRLYPEYKYGDRLAVTCKLQAPSNKDDSTFRYDKYLARYGVWSVCSFPKSVIVIPAKAGIHDNGGWIPGQARNDNGQRSFAIAQDDKLWVGMLAMQKIFTLKSIVNSQINRLWAEPESSFMGGLLYGSKNGLPPSLMENFSKTGLTHIIAVSGFNVTIIATVLMTLLIYLGLWRQQAFWVIVGSIVFFVIFTGLSASAVRAGIMAIVVLTGQYLGRLSRMGNVLVFTAALMVLANPYVLVWDAGFQLSFLATMGLVYISPLFDKIAPTKIPVVIRESLVSTLSAIITTLPLILYQFGRLSLVAPLVNVLILWIIPWLMLAGFLATIFSFIFFPLGQLIAWLAHVGLQYVLILVEWFGGRQWSAVEFQLPMWGMVGMYVILLWIVHSSKLKKQKENV